MSDAQLSRSSTPKATDRVRLPPEGDKGEWAEANRAQGSASAKNPPRGG